MFYSNKVGYIATSREKILREKESERDFGKAPAIQCTYEMIWIYNMLHL